MWRIDAMPVAGGKIDWGYRLLEEGFWDGKEGLRIGFHFSSGSSRYQRRESLKIIEELIQKNNISWITPGDKEWLIDLDQLKEWVPEIPPTDWFRGKVFVEPEFETDEFRMSKIPSYLSTVAFYVLPTLQQGNLMALEPPLKIRESSNRFRKDHPEPSKVAFIMMQFGKTKAHKEIEDAIKKTLASNGIKGVKANDKEYDSDLFDNVQTYLYGCGFGVAVFERLESDYFNPNVSFEVGYLFALKKEVCLLKDRTLEKLQTDIIGKLYRGFDPQDPHGTIPSEITKWLSDKKIV